MFSMFPHSSLRAPVPSTLPREKSLAFSFPFFFILFAVSRRAAPRPHCQPVRWQCSLLLLLLLLFTVSERLTAVPSVHSQSVLTPIHLTDSNSSRALPWRTAMFLSQANLQRD